MATPRSDSVTSIARDEVRTNFTCREGSYKLISSGDIKRSNDNPPPNLVTPVKLSYFTIPSDKAGNSEDNELRHSHGVVFNSGKEIYIHIFPSIVSILQTSNRMICNYFDYRGYKGQSQPTCVHVQQLSIRSNSVSLLAGFSAGQILYVDMLDQGHSAHFIFNDRRLFSKSKVTCVRWVPNSPNILVAAHADGELLVYDCDACSSSSSLSSQSSLPLESVPFYQLIHTGVDYSVYTCRGKAIRNPLFRWVIGMESSINALEFNSTGKLFATASQDGFVRIFDWTKQTLVGLFRSFFGGILCVCWSPDDLYVAAGGEDDLVTVYNVLERHVLCRCQGHQSWVSAISFDSYVSSSKDLNNDDLSDHNEDSSRDKNYSHASIPLGCPPKNDFPKLNYRLVSVGHDCLLCFWDLNESYLKISGWRRYSMNFGAFNGILGDKVENACAVPCPSLLDAKTKVSDSVLPLSSKSVTLGISNSSKQFASSTLNRRKPAQSSKNFSFNFSTLNRGKALRAVSCTSNGLEDQMSSSVGSGINQKSGQSLELKRISQAKMLGSRICPRLDQLPIIEACAVKRVSSVRLTDIFCAPECLFIASCEGVVSLWARPTVLDVELRHSDKRSSKEDFDPFVQLPSGLGAASSCCAKPPCGLAATDVSLAQVD